MILAFHGCPGLPTDFDLLVEALKQFAQAPELRALARDGYPGAEKIVASLPSGAHYLGYSFGTADCVEAAAKDPKAKSVILIAPYLFPTKELGAGMRVLLSIPALSDLLLLALGPKAMREMAEKTSHPEKPSPAYLATTQSYAKPAILRRAMTESQGRAAGIKQALSDLSQRSIPVLLIWGKEDQVSPEAAQIAPLRQIFPIVRELALDSTGHALLWLKPKELAQSISLFVREITEGENS